MRPEDKIISVVTEEYSVKKEDIIRQTRKKKIVEARQIIAYCLRLLNNLSFPAIGKILGGRDHTTIMHSCEKIAGRIEREEKFRLKLEGVLDLIRTPTPEDFIEAEEITEDDTIATEPEPLEEIKSDYVIPEKNLKLTPREEEILRDYRKGLTLQQIGEAKKITRERVRQLVTKAILKEAGAKIQEGFEIDLKEFFNGEKLAHDFSRDAMPEEEKGKLRSEFILKAESYISIPQFARDVGFSIAKLNQHFPDIVEIIEKKVQEKRDRWSQLYIKCRGCGTTKIPHIRKGYCEQCSGIYRGKRREEVLKESPMCSVCSIERGAAILKYGRDLYITRDRRVLCRGCFLQLTGGKLAEHRFSRLN